MSDKYTLLFLKIVAIFFCMRALITYTHTLPLEEKVDMLLTLVVVLTIYQLFKLDDIEEKIKKIMRK